MNGIAAVMEGRLKWKLGGGGGSSGGVKVPDWMSDAGSKVSSKFSFLSGLSGRSGGSSWGASSRGKG